MSLHVYYTRSVTEMFQEVVEIVEVVEICYYTFGYQILPSIFPGILLIFPFKDPMEHTMFSQC